MPTATAAVYGADGGALGPTMTRPKREDWTDWWPDEPTDPDQLLTRQQLVERAQAEGIDVTAQDIANWILRGHLPAGRLVRSGRALQARFPARYVDLLRATRAMQASGFKLNEVGPRLRRHYARQRRVSVVAVPVLGSSDTGYIRTGDAALTVDPALAEMLRGVARDHEQNYGAHIARIEIRLIDDRGHPLVMTVDID